MIKVPKECNLHSKRPLLTRKSCLWPFLYGTSVLWDQSSLLENRWCTGWMLAERTMERRGSSPQRWAASHWDAVFVACSQQKAGHHMLHCHWLRGNVHSHCDVWEIPGVKSEANSQQLIVPTTELFFDSDVPRSQTQPVPLLSSYRSPLSCPPTWVRKHPPRHAYMELVPLAMSP